ncbi:MAG: flavodoxin, short chain [Oscillospiraceae bacterium]|nr:flavodoxin, short chain [Oscillospiraceae bacterium]
MKKTAVVFWSGTGNTEEMAGFVKEGVLSAGGEVSIFTAMQFSPEKMDEFDSVAFGCPSMGAEVLEESEFEPMFQRCIPKLPGKPLALFGSYGWGDGEWMRNWEEYCVEKGAHLVRESVICQEQPDRSAQTALLDMGKALAE